MVLPIRDQKLTVTTNNIFRILTSHAHPGKYPRGLPAFPPPSPPQGIPRGIPKGMPKAVSPNHFDMTPTVIARIYHQSVPQTAARDVPWGVPSGEAAKGPLLPR